MPNDTNRLKNIIEDPDVPPKGRLELADESKFKNGQKPDETNFIQLFKSFINKVDDEIVVDDANNIGIGKSADAALDAKLHIDGTLKVAKSTLNYSSDGSAIIEGKLKVGEKITANSLQFEQGTEVNEISNSESMGGPGPSENSLSTQYAIKKYVDNKFANEVEPIAQELLDKFLVGCIVPFARVKTDEPPDGWLFCDGGSYNVQDKPELQNLFDVIEQHYGSGDGSESGFNVPDLRGIFIRGMDKDGIGRDPESTERISLAQDAYGTVIGNSLGGYQEDQFQDHIHTFKYTDLYVAEDSILGSDSFPQLLEHIIEAVLNPEIKKAESGDLNSYRQTIVEHTNVPTFGVSGPSNARFSSEETRPKNAIFMYCIKY
jgi:hypothetical protein